MAETNSIFLDLPDFYNKKINSEPRSETNIAIDTKKTLTNEVIAAEEDKSLNIGDINSFSQQSQNRNQIYNIIDQMCEDSTLSAALETYAEDATEYNDEGKIVWCESNDTNVANYINYLLQTMRIDKNIYKWVASLCKYGDLYLRLYRKSEYNDSNSKDRDILNEDVKIYDYKKDDKFVHYLEMASNPAEMFELTKFGKTYGYIKANVNNTSYTGSTNSAFNMYDSRQFTYKFKKNDIEIYDAMSYVHASLDDNLNRFPEEVNIFIDKDGQETQSTSYSVKRGQSIFFNVYKTWRYVKLLEDAILLNRISKSSITRIINIEVGDMPKENVQPCLQRIKSLIEQKAALSVNQSINEYTNPGPIDNAIYIPTYNGKGAITEQTLSTSDADIKSIVDLDYFKNDLFAGLKIPKQYLACLRGNTKILLLNGKTTTIEEMFNNKDEYIGKGIMSINKDGSLKPTLIQDVMLTNPATSFLRIHLDNGQYVDVTNNHRMMLRNGQFKLAEDLHIGDSLMPYYDYIKDGRRFVLDNRLGKYRPQYRIVAESVCTIPNGYQVHHKNRIKIDDDFDNLEPLTLAEHYREHEEELHRQNKEAYVRKKLLNNYIQPHTGQKMINNGIRQYWINGDEELPVGYSYGALPFTQEHRDNMSKAFKGVKKTYNCILNFGPDFHEKSDATKKIRKEAGAYNVQFDKKSKELKQRYIEKTGWFSPEAIEKRLSRFPPEKRCDDYTVRCLCCGKLGIVHKNLDWYNSYLNRDVFWFCSKECSKLNGAGKLPRSYRLYQDVNGDKNKYEYARWHGLSRPDTYFKYESLEKRLEYIESYVPECNHKVISIEHLAVSEPAYDISVLADCHTLALPCGIFVHNCTDDNTGFNGGTSLSLISSRYAKTVKRIQNTILQALTDAINVMLVDKQLTTYIGKFTLKMVPPMTQEENDRRESKSNTVDLISNFMSLFDMIEDPAVKLKMLKSFVTDVITDTTILNLIQEEIDKLESSDEPSEENTDNSSIDFDGDADNIKDRDININVDAPRPSSSDFGPEIIRPTVQQNRSFDDLPSPTDLNIDMTDSNNSEFD